MNNAIIAQVQAQAQAQLSTTMKRQQKRIDRAQEQKQELYALEDELAGEMSEAQDDVSKLGERSKLTTFVKGLGSVFGFGDAGLQAGLKLERLSVEQKRIDTELSQLKGEQSRATVSINNAIGVAKDAESTVQRGLDDKKAVANSRHRSPGSLASQGVAGGRVLAIESAQAETAVAMGSTATASADRARAEETTALREAAETHASAVKKRSKLGFGFQMKRLAFTAANAVHGASLAMPMGAMGMLTPMVAGKLGAAMLGGAVTSLSSSLALQAPQMSLIPALDGEKKRGVAKAAHIEVSAAHSAEMVKGAEKRQQAALRMAQDVRDTVADLRDHNAQIRA